MKEFGKLIQSTPFPLWKTPAGNTVQFRAHHEMSRICAALSDCCDLPVHCDCLSKGQVCKGDCMKQEIRILGVTIHLHGAPLCYSTPSALNDSWGLKWGPSLHSPWAMGSGILANVFTSSHINVLPVQFSWACFLRIISAWPQLAERCQHIVSPILRAMKTAIHKCCSRTVWCVDASKEWAVLQARHLPMSPKEAALLLKHWLIREAHWDGTVYASWHVPHDGYCSAHCAHWDDDFHTLRLV